MEPDGPIRCRNEPNPVHWTPWDYPINPLREVPMKGSCSLLWIGLFALLMGSWISGQNCRDMTYANENQIDTGDVMIVNSVKGTAMDVQGVVIPDVCIGIFSIDKHELLAVTSTNTDGYFEFKNLKVKDGTYRLVAEYDPLSVANHRIRIDSQDKSNKKILLRMKFYPGVSYFKLE